VTGGALRLEERGFRTSNLKTGDPDEREAISPLRQRMIEDMTVRKLGLFLHHHLDAERQQPLIPPWLCRAGLGVRLKRALLDALENESRGNRSAVDH
jgi:hypothetical protein